MAQWVSLNGNNRSVVASENSSVAIFNVIHQKQVDILISKNQALQILDLKHHDNVHI